MYIYVYIYVYIVICIYCNLATFLLSHASPRKFKTINMLMIRKIKTEKRHLKIFLYII